MTAPKKRKPKRYFQIFQDSAKAGQFWWRLKSINGRIIASSGESFKGRSGAVRSIKGVLKLTPETPIQDETGNPVIIARKNKKETK